MLFFFLIFTKEKKIGTVLRVAFSIKPVAYFGGSPAGAVAADSPTQSLVYRTIAC